MNVPIASDLSTGRPDEMDEFLERVLGDRRTLQQALADIVAKYSRIPRGLERSMLERMIEVLNAEITLRQNKCEAERACATGRS